MALSVEVLKVVLEFSSFLEVKCFPVSLQLPLLSFNIHLTSPLLIDSGDGDWESSEWAPETQLKTDFSAGILPYRVSFPGNHRISFTYEVKISRYSLLRLRDDYRLNSGELSDFWFIFPVPPLPEKIKCHHSQLIYLT